MTAVGYKENIFGCVLKQALYTFVGGRLENLQRILFNSSCLASLDTHLHVIFAAIYPSHFPLFVQLTLFPLCGYKEVKRDNFCPG